MAATELGAFIRSRREAITPPEVGLPMGPRRRTPGLRRAELATIAGVSVDYLIRLEQGRDTNPSPAVVIALAEALQLDEEDRFHLKKLAALSGQGRELCPTRVDPARAVRAPVAAVLDQLASTPAFVLNELADVIAWSDAYDRIAGPIGILDGAPPNLLRFTFGDERARTAFPEWDRIADEQVANLRSGFPTEHRAVEALVEELRVLGGDDFSTRWTRHDVGRKATGTKQLRHPDVGLLRLVFETTTLSDAAEQRLVIYVPADADTAERLDELEGRGPGRLYAVAGGR